MNRSKQLQMIFYSYLYDRIILVFFRSDEDNVRDRTRASRVHI